MHNYPNMKGKHSIAFLSLRTALALSRKKPNEDHFTKLWVLILNAIPPVGFVLYFKYRQQYPNRAESALTCALAGVPITKKAGCFLNTYILN